ncbi:MAG: DUF4339 domain-containing protein, partial [Planctomycetaceae bacterium]|nr:DUF4339 domain-containing protein [Planctomycetaceae bacterium]
MMAAAENPSGGGAAEGMGLGMGFAMANRMAGGFAPAAPGMQAPPPPPQLVWHIAVGGQTQGPFDQTQLAQGIQSGQVTRETLVWNPGLGNWTAAGQVPQLGAYFGAATPPPPPPVP